MTTGNKETPFEHTPVMLKECIAALSVKPGGTYFDGTLGGAGHAGAVCSRLNGGTFIGCDRDEAAIAAASERLERYRVANKVFLIKSRFNDIGEILSAAGTERLDGALLDLGVSSHQLDTAERGFSYMNDAPLDMRMDRAQRVTAYGVVNGYGAKALTKIFREYGEEKWAVRIAEFIIEERKTKPIETTFELVTTIKKAVPKAARQEGIHPAKRVFQAIRIEVNDELAALGQACAYIAQTLNSGGRLAVITFHSLEDRIVKQSFRALEDPCPTCPAPNGDPCVCGRQGRFEVITRKPILPSDEETEANPRARSAKLRIIQKR